MYTLYLLLCAFLAHSVSSMNHNAINAFKRLDKYQKYQPRAPASHVPQPQKRGYSQSRFLNSYTQRFLVNGTGIPDVDFDAGESYAGLLPISSDPNETRKLFFWFFPSTNPAAGDEIAIWLNGGPGCSSLSGFLSENGPILWQAGTLAPTQNPYSWTNLTNMVWVEQPIGVGYTQGVPNITNEVELGQEFIGFYKQFVDAFQLQNWGTYVTGESYAGFYVPYIADAFIQANDKQYYNLKGIAINDPIIGDSTNQQETVIAPFANYWQNLMYLNDTFVESMNALADACNYTSYLEKYLTFPPPGPLPIITESQSSDLDCGMFDYVYAAALEVNPCFNIYHITDTCPHLWNVLGIINRGDYSPPGEVVYFNRTDVKEALHAPLSANWQQCTETVNVFGGVTQNRSLHDTSVGPAQDGVLQRVIEYTNNAFIGQGNLDMLLSTNGTLLEIQNMTWNGMQGLQSYPGTPLYVPYHPEYNGGALAGAGYAGYWGSERGLTFYQVQLSGHELPGYAPGAAYRMLEILLGRIPDFSDTSDFTTQTGNYTAMP